MSNANELAHPVALESYPARDGDYTKHEVTGGLTKRELIAAMAMQGLLSNPVVLAAEGARQEWLHPDYDKTAIEEEAVARADALLAELERTA